MAIPFAFRLYHSKKLCPEAAYAKRTELARELLELITSWALDRGFTLVGDSEYACRTLVRGLPADAIFVGPMCMKAALYEPPPARKKRTRGRPPKKGPRLPTPAELAGDDSVPWARLKVTGYGKPFEVLTKTMVCLWYTVAGARLVRLLRSVDVIALDGRRRLDAEHARRLTGECIGQPGLAGSELADSLDRRVGERLPRGLGVLREQGGDVVVGEAFEPDRLDLDVEGARAAEAGRVAAGCELVVPHVAQPDEDDGPRRVVRPVVVGRSELSQRRYERCTQ